MITEKRILLIGGTGSLGKELLKILLKTNAEQITVFSRNEYNLVKLKQQLPDERIQIMVGDIRDKNRLMYACRNIDIVFHLAALKHVPVCEQMPGEAILTNVSGTQFVAECAIQSGVKKVIYTSTDKAVTPQCAYGCTKLLGEKIILSANSQSDLTRFMVFRSGNLLGSSGSVIPLFQKQINESGIVWLTDRRMNRFFVTILQAAALLIEAAEIGKGGEIFLPRMDSLSIYDIAKYLLEKKQLDETHIKIMGMRPGEKLNESMASEEESRNICSINKQLFMLSQRNDRQKYETAENILSPYQFRSQDAILPYQQTCSFLASADI